MKPKYRYYDIIEFGGLFDAPCEKCPDEAGVDAVATHKNRDKVIVATLRQYGEILRAGMADPRDIGKYLKDLADEAEAIEEEVGFGYELL